MNKELKSLGEEEYKLREREVDRRVYGLSEQEIRVVEREYEDS